MDEQKPSTDAQECPGCVERDRRIVRLEARLAEYEKRTKKLEQLIDKTQRGAKRQAAPFSKGLPKADPRKPGRKRGDDYGTKAFRSIPETIDEQFDAPLPDQCPHCGASSWSLEGVDHQYQTEIPTQPIHRRFNIQRGRCACCRKVVRGRHPLQTSDATGCCASQLGPTAQATIVHLNKHAGLSQGKIADLFESAFGIRLTRGGACQAMLRAARRCETPYRKIVQHVRRSPSCTSDETGWRIGGWSAWLHAAVTPDAAAYLIDRSRGYQAMKLLAGEAYKGILVHDGYKSYLLFEHAVHQTCLAHLMRRCADILETATRGAVRFPRQIKGIFKEALEVRTQRDAEKMTLAEARRRADELQARIVERTKRIKTNIINDRLADHLYQNQHHLFTFLRHKGIDATNWRAEQALRPAVVNRKVWGGNRTEIGAQAQSILMSVWQTAQRQTLNPIDWLSQHLRSPTLAPSLLPAPSG